MDIKPFVYELDYWAVSGLALIIGIVSTIATIVGFLYAGRADKGWAVIITMLGVIGTVTGFTFAIMLPDIDESKSYKNYVTEAQKTLEADGFTIVSGTPQLKPNGQSDLLLEYKGKSFDCTLFSPKDVNKTVVFSCGEAKLSLEEVKNTVGDK